MMLRQIGCLVKSGKQADFCDLVDIGGGEPDSTHTYKIMEVKDPEAARPQELPRSWEDIDSAQAMKFRMDHMSKKFQLELKKLMSE